MDFFVIGVSHHQTPVEVREKFASLSEAERHLYHSLAESGLLAESLVLSTCNRLEIVAISDRHEDGRQAVLKSMAAVSGLTPDQILPYAHEYVGLKAAGYIFKVASSLDSLVLGEPQILGQVKEAFRQSLDYHRAGQLINKLMHRAFRTAKRVRSETCLAGGTVSVASAAVSLARSLRGGDLRNASVLLLGAGPMAYLAAAHLKKRQPADLVVMNRSLAKAEILADKHGLRCRPWDEFKSAVLEADLIIAATGAQSPILTLDGLEKIMALRGQSKPLTIIDIGVPRNAGHDLKRLSNIILRNIDDLNEVVWENRSSRKEAADKAQAIIDEEVKKFGQWIKSLACQPTVAALTIKAETIRQHELQRTLNQHKFSPDQRAALDIMTSALVRRLLHDPLTYIKQTGEATLASGCRQDWDQCRPKEQCLISIRRAFNIDPDKTLT